MAAAVVIAALGEDAPVIAAWIAVSRAVWTVGYRWPNLGRSANAPWTPRL